MKALITGGAGFIGSHLAQGLLALGHQVVALDDLSTGRLSNIERLSVNPGFRFVNRSVLDEPALEPLVSDADLIYHLAAAVGVDYIMGHLTETLESNVRGTENVIRLAYDCGKKKVILASTSEVYGKSQAVPFKEDGDLLLGPTKIGRWGYACSKILDEFLALAYHKERGLPIVILRLFNTVGPRQSGRYGMVLPRFVSQALEGNPITVYGDGCQTRCFTFVGDAVDAIIKISQVSEAEGLVFNIGSNREVSINELASLVKETLSSTSPILHVPYAEAYGAEFEDVPRRVPEISRILRYIDFQPYTELGRIIGDLADDLAEHPGETTAKDKSMFGRLGSSVDRTGQS